jgi:hypothetical protein
MSLGMASENPFQKNDLNECGSCRCWKSGLCVGGGFDGSQTQSNETCSMWKPLIDKERILPIFYPKEVGDQ